MSIANILIAVGLVFIAVGMAGLVYCIDTLPDPFLELKQEATSPERKLRLKRRPPSPCC